MGKSDNLGTSKKKILSKGQFSPTLLSTAHVFCFVCENVCNSKMKIVETPNKLSLGRSLGIKQFWITFVGTIHINVIELIGKINQYWVHEQELKQTIARILNGSLWFLFSINQSSI